MLRQSFCQCFIACLVLSMFARGDDTNLNALPMVPEGFEVTMYAREPLVRNPCSIAFDARGRMFVSMGPQYRNPTPETPPDSVVIVKDDNGDGTADQAIPFATGFNCIQSLAWHGRDLWVANSPDLTVVRDLDGDDVADEYVKVYTDLGNIEHGIHGLNWAPDGRLYMSKGNSKGLAIKDWVKGDPTRVAPKPFRELWGVPGPADAPEFPAPQRYTKDNYKSAYQDPRDDWGRMGGVLRCDDMGANLEIVARGLRNPYDIAFDHGFDWLGTDQDQNEGDRLFMPFYSAEYGWSHDWSPNWTGENHLPTVPISAPVFLGSGTGVIFADSPVWPEKYRNVWIINDWLLKSTHVYRAVWDGALMQPQGGKWETFVSGDKALYRPVDMAFGADGALYILGWGSGYGVERDKAGAMTNEGRIYRVMPKGAAKMLRPSDLKLLQMSVPLLMAEFESVLPVRRIDAQDELARRGNAVLPELDKAFQDGKLSMAQETWTLWAMARASADGGFFERLASDRSATLNRRIQSLRVLGWKKDMSLSAVIKTALRDKEPRIRFAAVQAVHQAHSQSLLPALVEHSAHEMDRVTYFATWRAMRDLGGTEALKPLLKDSRPQVRCAALLGLLDLKAMRTEDQQVFTRDTDDKVRTVAQLGLGKPSLEAKPAGNAAAGAFALASNVTPESKRPYSTGKMLPGETCYTDRAYVFKNVPDLLKGAFIIRTANADDHSAGQSFVAFDLAVDATVTVAHDVRIRDRPQWLQAYADTDLTVTTSDVAFHLWSKEFAAGKIHLGGNVLPKTKVGAGNYFVIIQPKPLPPRSTPTLMADSLEALKNANPRRGESLFFFSAGCAACHRVGERGTNFAPDLSALGSRMEPRYIVQSMLDPNAVIAEGFSAHVVEAAGKSYFGILLSTGGTLKLGLITGEKVEIPATTITKNDTLPVSPMPPQAMLLGPQDVADITAWLRTQTGVTAPGAAAATVFKISSDPIAVQEQLGRLVFTQGGAAIGEYLYDHPKVLRPCFANLRAPGGVSITRTFPPVEGVDATDHADLHPGLWLGFGDLAGEDFWRNQGRIRHDRFLEKAEWKNGSLVFATQSSVLTHTGAVMAEMTNRFELRPQGQVLRIVWSASITPLIDGFYFGDQEEMGLGVRVATGIIEKNGGLITSSSGLTTAKNTWGRPAAWCDYSGLINGHYAGVTIIPDAANALPSWWHNRDYGVFVANAFGRKAMKQGETSRVEVKKGAAFTLRHTILLHSSDNTAAPDLAKLVKDQLSNR